MALNKGPQSTAASNLEKYSAEQLEKFKQITTALDAKDFNLARELTINLSPENDEKFDEYLYECNRILPYRASEEVLKSHKRQEIETSEMTIIISKSKSSEILHLQRYKSVTSIPRNNPQSDKDGVKKKKDSCKPS